MLQTAKNQGFWMALGCPERGVSENIFIEGEGELMLKIYDKEVFIIDMEEFQTDAVQILENITENPDYDKMVFLLRKRKRVICASNLQKILNNNLTPKVFTENGGGGIYGCKRILRKESGAV